jgi:hypothetical protein
MMVTSLTMEGDIPRVRTRPHTNAHFVVDLGRGDATDADAGFCEVVFPEFRIDPQRVDRGDAPQVAPPSPTESSTRRLILRRGVTGSRNLYEWWDETRRGTASSPRTVTVHLMTPRSFQRRLDLALPRSAARVLVVRASECVAGNGTH